MELAVVSIALGTLRDLLFEEARFLSGVSSEVKVLQTQLKEIKCLLEDADKRKHESKTVLNWIAEIRNLAYRSEDAIETCAVQVSSKRGQGFKNLFRRFTGVLNEGLSVHCIGSEISDIKSEIARVSKSMQEYGLKSIIQGESSNANINPCDHDENQYWKRRTFPFEIEECFVGKEDELRQLVSLVVDDNQHRVISILGMGGIGKTTITRKVYNHIDTKHSFQSFAWICISQQCQIRSVLEEVHTQLTQHKGGNIPNMTNTELIKQLREIQTSRRCIIVLDDLWEIGHWDGMKHAFMIEGSNSKVLLTSRKQRVADVGYVFELGLLNINDGWALLQKKAFQQSNFVPDFAIEQHLLEKIGKEMVDKCGYLPLVISLLGGILGRKKSTEEWELVNDNINACIFRGSEIEKENEIHEVLNMSYEDLPYYLKPCFLYMGQFREDQTISLYTLYRLWIAEGMISHVNHGKEETLMDIAELYLSELASRCLVQVQVEDVIPLVRYRSCHLHDVVRELCLSKGVKEDFRSHSMDYRGGKLSTLLNENMSGIKTRRLAIHFETEIEQELKGVTITCGDTNKHIRSLQFLNHSPEKTIEFRDKIVDFKGFKLLRVLVFKNFSFAGRKLPRGIGDLVHLRYLCLRSCELDELPSSISNLSYLYTLDLLNSRNVRVPSVLKNMRRLKQLFLPYYDKEKVGSFKLSLEGLDELEALSGFNSLLHDLKYVIRMKNLRHLAAIVHDNEIMSEIIDAIATNWKYLRYCAVSINDVCSFTSTGLAGSIIFREVFSCPNLHHLSVNVKIGKLLQESGTQIINSRIVSLCLSECEIEDDPMELLGKLPFLEELRLLKRSFVGEEMKCHALGFPRLKNLILDSLPNLSDWKVEKGAMPVICEIEINSCPRLKMIPYELKFIAPFQKLKIFGMPELEKQVPKLSFVEKLKLKIIWFPLLSLGFT